MEKITRTSIASNKETYINMQIEECAENLTIANKEGASQQKETRKHAAELLIANKKLTFQNEEQKRCAEKLRIANKKLLFENKEKQKRAEELSITNKSLKKAQGSQNAYIQGLKEMMFMISHQIRQPIVQLLGLTDILNTSTNSPQEVNEIVGHIKTSAESLNSKTKEFTTFIHDQEIKAKC